MVAKNKAMKEILNIDCMDKEKGLPSFPDNFFDLAIVDPPYGMNSLDGSRTKNKYGINRRDNWDCVRPDKCYFLELFRTSKQQNYSWWKLFYK